MKAIVLITLIAGAVIVLIRAMYLRYNRGRIGHNSPASQQAQASQQATTTTQPAWWNPRGWRRPSTRLIITILIVVLLLPILWPLGKLIVLAWALGMRDTFYTSRPSPQPAPHTQHVVVTHPQQAVDLRNLLKWDDDAKKYERGRVTHVTTHNGICFVDAIPPQVSVKLKLTCMDDFATGQYWETYLIEYVPEMGFLSGFQLQKHSTQKTELRAGIFALPELGSQTSKKERSLAYNNLSGGDSAPVLTEEYLQFSDVGQHRMVIDRETPPGVYQFVVEVGRTPTSITLLHRNFKWLWVTPVHHPEWQCTVNGVSIPSTGVDDAATRASMKDCKEVDQSKNPFSLIVSGFSGQSKILDRGVLANPTNVTGRIGLRINAPGIPNVKPAKVIVGYQL